MRRRERLGKRDIPSHAEIISLVVLVVVVLGCLLDDHRRLCGRYFREEMEVKKKIGVNEKFAR